MKFDWSVVWNNAPALAEGTLLTIVLTVLTMLIAVPAGILLALMRLLEHAGAVGRERRLRRVLPQPAADPRRLLGLLRDAGPDRHRVLRLHDRARGALPQRLGL